MIYATAFVGQLCLLTLACFFAICAASGAGEGPEND